MAEFTDNSDACISALERACKAWLNEAAGEIQSQAQQNTRVKSSATKNSWQYKVSQDGKQAVVGSNMPNAIYEEYGTGIFAEKGGRQTPWVYRAPNGKFYRTRGKKGTRAFRRAYKSIAPMAQRQFADILRRLS